MQHEQSKNGAKNGGGNKKCANFLKYEKRGGKSPQYKKNRATCFTPHPCPPSQDGDGKGCSGTLVSAQPVDHGGHVLGGEGEREACGDLRHERHHRVALHRGAHLGRAQAPPLCLGGTLIAMVRKRNGGGRCVGKARAMVDGAAAIRAARE